ncbi:MAG: fimbrial protein [Bacteroidales bacterium]|nr:fimbrial protein [Bacteroidales bacterium]MDD4684173.1 fimbrial protein [Bacteroidales bacterium]
MRRRLLYILLMIIPLLSGCISDDCTDCADMAYDTRVKLKVTWPRSLSSNTTKSGNDDIYINNFTLFVFNNDGTLNTVKKVNNPSGTGTITFTTSVNMNITSAATYIYAIANCNDLLTASPTSTIAQQVNANMNNLKTYFDSTLSVGVDGISEGGLILLTGYTNSITQSGPNPYEYVATVYLKPIVSKFDIKVSSSAPADYINCIQNIEVFVLNSRSKAKLFSPNTNFTYLHGKYESFWWQYPYRNFEFADTNNQNTNLAKQITYTQRTLPFTTPEVTIYSPENDTLASLGNGAKTLVVLKVKYKMKTIEGVDEEFTRFLTVPLNPPTGLTLSNKRGTRYTINFTLSGKYFGAMSPLSSLMQPYSPLPYKTTKNLIYVAPEDYSTVKSSVWK